MSTALHIAGSLGASDFPDLLQWLANGRQTGTLVVSHGLDGRRVEKHIVFSRGRIIATASNDPKEYLGHFLVSHGFLDEEALAQAMAMQRKNKVLIGKILVTLGAIDARDLEAMLRLKAEESIYEVFTWQGAGFEFQPGKLPEFPMVPLSLDVSSLVLEGVRRVDEWTRIRQAIPSPLCVPVAVGELAAPADEPAAARILALVDDDRSIEDIALASHASEFVVCRALFDQVEAGRLKVVRPRVVPAAGAAPHPEAAASARVHEALERVHEGSLEEALHRLREADSLRDPDRQVELLAAEVEGRIREAVAAAGIVPQAVPRLAVDIEQAAASGLTAHEGFLMSRIDGRYNVEAITKITPMAPLETEVALWKLLRAGFIRLGE